MSILFGMVMVALASHFMDIVGALQNQLPPGNPSMYLKVISWIAVIFYCFNTMRMGHGFVISLYDKRNPTGTGNPPYCPSEMGILMLTLLAPYISIQLLSNFWNIDWFDFYGNKTKCHLFWLVIWYMFPHLIYLIWDTSLRHSLKKMKNKDRDDVKLYTGFVNFWFWSDIVVVLIVVFMLVVIGFKKGLSRSIVLTVFGALHALIFIFDYLIVNKKYYYPHCGPT